MARELFPDFQIVLKDAVVDCEHGAVRRDMRVRIGLRGDAVGRPARVPDAAVPLQRMAVVGLISEDAEPSLGFDNNRFFVAIADSNAGGVIAAVFQLLQTLQQNGGSLPAADVSNNSAHKKPPFQCAYHTMEGQVFEPLVKLC